MRKLSWLCLFIWTISSCKEKKFNDRLGNVHEYVDTHLDSLQDWLNDQFIPLTQVADKEKVRASFLEGRRRYKRIEFAVEYFFPSSARGINGPPLPEIEAEEHAVTEPGGFQVMEEFLFPYDDSAPTDLIREAKKLNSLLHRVDVLWETMKFRDDQVFEALRLECFRIITLGISGFDTPASFAAITEIPLTLESVQQVTTLFGDSKPLTRSITAAIEYANEHRDFNSFDRLGFITKYINPLTSELLDFQESLNIPIAPHVSGLNSGLRTLFDRDGFNVNYFTPNKHSYVTPAKVSLGRQLFFDARISGNKKISCGSCHQPGKAFTDGLQKNKTFLGDKLLRRNTPTLLNAALQRGQFYDMRAIFLEDQVRNVIENKDEIHGSLKDAVDQFSAESLYVESFQAAFGDEINETNMQVALACYVRSLTSFESRFDKHMRGEEANLTPEEQQGFNLFMGKAKCGTCHFMPLFNGTVPPAFTFTESEVIGVPADSAGKKLDDDRGRFDIYKVPNFMHAFKTPTTRNVEFTAPYMHNGVYGTLDQVMTFYNKGGGQGLGFMVDNQTLPFDSLSLSANEMRDVIAFMKTLSDVNVKY